MDIESILEFDDEFPGERYCALLEPGSGGGKFVGYCWTPCWSIMPGRNSRR